MRLVEIADDGNCMFRAIAQADNVLTTGQLLSKKGETTVAKLLREMVGEYVVEHPERVASTNFYDFYEGVVHHTMQQYKEFIPRYLKWLHQKPASWGEERELNILADILDVGITLYTPDGRLYPTLASHPERARQVALRFTPELHYDLLVPDDTGFGVPFVPEAYYMRRNGKDILQRVPKNLAVTNKQPVAKKAVPNKPPAKKTVVKKAVPNKPPAKKPTVKKAEPKKKLERCPAGSRRVKTKCVRRFVINDSNSDGE
jgi:hypothetical protein